MKVAEETYKKKFAILFFSRNVEAEIQYKRWMPKQSKLNNRLFGRHLIEQSNSVFSSCNLPIFHSHEGNQVGNSFGERLSNAFQKLFLDGYDAVIAVGNDCPELNMVNWEDLKAKLESGQSVFGPTQLGGTYLIALTKEAFLKEGFENLPWKTSSVFQALYDFYRKKTLCYILPRRIELNGYSDLVEAMRLTNISQSLRDLLRSLLLGGNQSIDGFKESLYTLSLFIRADSRGPPLLI